jgi:hypothetical protein
MKQECNLLSIKQEQEPKHLGWEGTQRMKGEKINASKSLVAIILSNAPILIESATARC